MKSKAIRKSVSAVLCITMLFALIPAFAIGAGAEEEVPPDKPSRISRITPNTGNGLMPDGAARLLILVVYRIGGIV